MTDQLDVLKQALSDCYAVEREIGSGGMATVYLAEDVRHHRKVAIKVLRPDLAAALGPERFLREIEIAAQLQHPHILPLLDSGRAVVPSLRDTERGTGGEVLLYYVMPYVEGQSLREKIAKEGELPIGDAVRIVRDVVDALTEAHAHGVVHRDIKPENILLRGRHALVTDFGVAKAVSEATGREQLTTAGVALGTPAYMAPEQAAADPHVDHRVDIYAVGAVAYELLTGRPVFMGTTPQMILSAHVTEAPQPVTKHRDTVPAALESVVMRCLEKKPADRYQSAEELLPQLEAVATPSGGMTPTETRPISAVRHKRKGMIVSALAAVVVLGTLGGWYLVTGRGSAFEESRVVVAPFEDLTGDPEYADLGRIAANYVTQRLQETDLVSVVPAMDVIGIEFSSASDLAAQTGAGLVVGGDYYLEGDSLFFRSEIVDAEQGELLDAPALAGAQRDDRMRAVEALRQRVLGALAMHVDSDIADWVTAMSSAPTFEAYREWTMCLQRYMNRLYADAVERCSNAYTADTTFLDPLIMAAMGHFNRGEDAQADSIAAMLTERQERLAGLSGIQAQWLRAVLDGDLPRSLGLVRTAVQGNDVPNGWKYELGLEASMNNRPREAIEALERFDPDRGVFRDWTPYWSVLANAYHMTGDYQGELEVARSAKERHPDQLAVWNLEVRALIGLGRVSEALEVLDQSLPLGLPTGAMRDAALELRAHGSPDEAEDLLERAVQWFRSQPSERLMQLRSPLAYTLFCHGKLEEAEQLYRQLRGEDLESAGHLGYLGIIAARSGRTAEARAIDDSLAAWDVPYSRGLHTRYRAGLAAWLGEQERAVMLLRQAFREGRSFNIALHRYTMLQPLWDYEPFIQFLRPRG